MRCIAATSPPDMNEFPAPRMTTRRVWLGTFSSAWPKARTDSRSIAFFVSGRSNCRKPQSPGPCGTNRTVGVVVSPMGGPIGGAGCGQRGRQLRLVGLAGIIAGNHVDLDNLSRHLVARESFPAPVNDALGDI